MSETTTHAPSPEQQAVYDWVVHGSGSGVLEAVAGAGKTTTLVGAVRLMEGSVFLGAYNKKMVDELKLRTAGLYGVVAGTFHSAGFSALRRSVPRSAGIGKPDEKKVRRIVDRMAETSPRLKPFSAAVVRLVSLAKQTGFLIEGLVRRPQLQDWTDVVEHYEVLDDLPDELSPDDMIVVCRTAAQALNESNRLWLDARELDFDDMVYLPLLLGLRMFQNDWVLIDEAQDVNATRRMLARKMLRRGGRLLAVGDPHQAIYGFSGADSESLSSIRRDFSAQTMRLSVSWRCPRAVVTEARLTVDHIRPAETAPEGEVLDMSYEQMLDAVKPGDAVICRYNRYVVELCFRLIRLGRPAKIEGRSIGDGLAALAGKWRVKTLDALEGRLERHLERELEKAAAKDDDARAARVEDQVATLEVLIKRSRETGVTTVTGLQDMVRDMFVDAAGDGSLVLLSSVHRSKGLEFPRVFVLGRRELMPGRASQDWQRQQERNLIYVATTRAQKTLVHVDLALADQEALDRKRNAAEQQAA